jgi:hypothetical protein
LAHWPAVVSYMNQLCFLGVKVLGSQRVRLN